MTAARDGFVPLGDEKPYTMCFYAPATRKEAVILVKVIRGDLSLYPWRAAKR